MDSLGEFKQTRVLRRPPSADDVAHLDTSIEQPTNVEITLCVGGNRDIKLTVSEKTTRDELRRVVSTHQGGRCMVEPDQLPLRNGTEVRVIPVFIPQVSEEAHMNTVVAYMRFKEHFRPVAILPDVPDEFLEKLAESDMGQPCKVSVPHRPIRTGDEIRMITANDAQIRQEIQLQALREEDKMPSPPAAYTHVFQKYWDYLNNPLAHPDCCESDFTKAAMYEFASALSQMDLSSFAPEVDVKLPDESCRVAHDAAVSRRCPIQDAVDYWLRSEEAATVSGGSAPGQGGHNVHI
jgi:hypothetical protein